MEGLHSHKRLRHCGILTPVAYIHVESWLSKSAKLKDLQYVPTPNLQDRQYRYYCL